MLNYLKTTLWGTISREERHKFSFLALTFFLIIGTYSMVRPLKDAVFMRLVGKYYLPYAKLATFVFLIPLIMLYSKLIDWVAKDRVFYVIALSYAIAFLTIAFMFTHPMHGLANTIPSGDRMLGWIFYIVTESFSSLMVTLFWSLVASSTNFTSAQKGYPLIVAGAQVGAILGPECAKNASYLGLPLIVSMVSGCLLITIVLVRHIARESSVFKDVEPTRVTGPIEGLRLLFTHRYLVGMFALVTLPEIISILVEYRFLLLADHSFASIEKITEFIAWSIQLTNIVTLFFALLGTGVLVRKLGLTFCLLLIPVCAGTSLLYASLFPSLWSLLGVLMLVKSLGYALNRPCKEMLYIPTSVDIKFKAKSWIDAFGDRSSKAMGSSLNAVFNAAGSLVLFGSCAAFGIIGVWTFAALFMGRAHAVLMKNDTTMI